MEYYVKSVVPMIESNYDNLTMVEKTIAEFFIRNRKKMDFSAKCISELLYVSEASLSRFAKKCGYRGYREFVYQYEETFVEKKESMTGNTRMVLNAYQELLNKTYNLVDEAQVARIGRYLNQSKRVFVCGRGSSGLTAEEMEFRFMRIGVDIDSIKDVDLMRMQAVFQDKESLVFGISISGEKEEVLYLLRKAHRRGAKTVLLTAKNKGIFEEFCDEIVLLPSLRHLNHGNVISPQFPVLVMIDIIYSYFVEQDKFAREILHDNTLRALEGGGRQMRSISEEAFRRDAAERR
ncbi:MurR/RpiR family transcriptional regulator [Sporofaciens sp. JLR.KK001]|uniref:MurR/RpiR family transcriptional regulator n=1 Tax=Sporofaciens sp. JLR.KK001 TaxID=3112621 RepID=UPI002FF093BC